MRHIIIAAAALAALTVAAPASAQVKLDAGPDGVGVRVGPRHDRVIREYDRGKVRPSLSA
jgi:hypothetical protein